MGQYIESHLRKKWDDWKKDWFYTALPDHHRLQLPAGPRERSAGWQVVAELGEEYDAVRDRLRGLRSRGLTAAMVFGDYFRRRIAPLQERPRGAWEYTGYNGPMRTHVDQHWDWSEEDVKTVVRRVLSLDTVEPTLIPDRILPLCSDRDWESILAVMMVVGTGRGRSRLGVAGGGGGNDAGSNSAAAGGGRASGSGGGGSSRVPGPSHGAGGGPAADPKGKRKISESVPPSPPCGGDVERATDRPPASHKRPTAVEPGQKKKRLRKIG